MQIDKLLKAAAEPTRLRILNLLRFGPVCVCDVQAVLNLPQPVVSRHLGVLRHAGLVVDRRRGNRILYALVAPASPQAEAVSQLVKSCAACEDILRDDIRKLTETLEHGPCAIPAVSSMEAVSA